MATTAARVRAQGVIIEGQRYPARVMGTHGTCDVCTIPMPMGCVVYATIDGKRLVCLACGNRLDTSTDADAQAGGDT